MLEVMLEPARSSPSRARSLLRECLPAGFDRLDDVLLCATELVTNAVLHAGTPCRLSVERRGAWVLLRVCDFNPASQPVVRDFDRTAITGRGLQLVDKLTDRWGIDTDDQRKCIWFEVDARRESAGDQ